MEEKTIDYLIVPCPGDPRFHEDRIVFKVCEDSKEEKGIKRYLGAEDRMKAAVLKSNNAKNVILVGGSQSKVTAMYIYFRKKLCVFNKNPELICLVSKPDSTGNLAACKKYFDEKVQDINSKKIAVVSNTYHLDRLKLISKDIFNNHTLSFLAAEKVLDCEKEVKEQYGEEWKQREFLEKKGRRDWKKKLYGDQDKIIRWDPKFWKCEKITLDFKSETL